MKVLRYEVHNVLRISDIDIDCSERNLILVGGKNGQGKSSAIKALALALCGRSGIAWPDVVLKEGEDEGSIKVELSGSEDLHELSGLTAELRFERQRDGSVKEKFRLLDSSGDPAPEPRTLLKRLYSTKAFDPLSFDRMEPSEQKNLLCRLVGIDLDKYEKDYQEAYSHRAEVNREGKSLKPQIDAMPVYPDAKKVDINSLVSQLEEVREKNRSKDRIWLGLQREQARAKEIDGHIKQLQKELDGVNKNVKSLTEQHNSLEDCNKRETELTQELRGAQQSNFEYEQNLLKEGAVSKLEDLREESKHYTEKMSEIVFYKERELREAKWPVPGLSVDKDGVLFNSLPLWQAAKSERIFVSTMIGIALNPELRLMVCEDGNDLDNDTLSVLGSLLEKHNFQLLLEMVTRSEEDEGRCAVVIEEGRVKSG